MRPVDASALIDRFNKLAEKYRNVYDLETPASIVEECALEVSLAPTLDITKDNIVPDNYWIPVNQFKPEVLECISERGKQKPVLLYSENGQSMYIGWYIGKDYRGIDSYISRTSLNAYQCITRKITHWMPLPEPPYRTDVKEKNDG